MRTLPVKILAVSVIIVTAISLLLSVFFLVQTWRFRKPATEKLQSLALQTARILETSQKGLNITEQVITNIYSSTVTLEDSTTSLANTAETSSEFIGSIGSFMGEGLINTITNTQVAIDSAQASAIVIDNILTAMSNIPFIGIKYNPSRPLNVALGEISASLDPIQSSLWDFKTTLSTTQASMQDFKDQALGLNQNIISLNRNLESARTVIVDYQDQLKSLHDWMNKAVISVSRWLTTICWVITFFIFWLILVQVAILFQAANIFVDKTGTVEQTNHFDN